jgi:hypothetical protein
MVITRINCDIVLIACWVYTLINIRTGICRETCYRYLVQHTHTQLLPVLVVLGTPTQ